MINYNNLNMSNFSMNKLGRKIAEKMANEIVSVQPMPNDVMQKLLENSKHENDLIREGYEPVSHFKLLWMKK